LKWFNSNLRPIIPDNKIDEIRKTFPTYMNKFVGRRYERNVMKMKNMNINKTKSGILMIFEYFSMNG
jgi:hypothetical protein